MQSVSVVISYCANDVPFIDKTLSECNKFSDDVIVVYGSRMYDGADADLAAIGVLSDRHEWVQFCMYDVDLTLDPYAQEGVCKRPLAYWHNLARWTGICRCLNDWILLLDGDEVPDGAKVRRWLHESRNPETIFKAANYWYFKHPENQATSLEDSVLLVHKRHLTRSNVFGDMERDHICISASSGAKLERLVKDPNGDVMFHHFSWVRGREGLKRKLRSFAHSQDMFKNVDIDVLVEYIYRNDDVNDVIHNYKYVHVDSFLQER
jgi:hypothetical protein